MATITITVADEQGNTVSLQVHVQDTVETLKALVEVEMHVPRAEQVLLKDGVPLSPGASLSACAVVDNDFLFLVRDQGNSSSASSSTTTSTTTSTRTSTSNVISSGSRTSTTAAATTSVSTATVGGGAGLLRSLNDLPPGLGPEQFMTILNDNPRLLAELKHHNAPLAAAISSGDVVKVRSVQMKQKLQAMASRMEEQQALQALEANPMDPEAQRKIEEMIQKENVLRNMEAAMDEMPEAFGSVVMLYVDVEVNGHPIKAFVDSGAQSTIMSAACARRCDLSRLIDTRFEGIAKGVGTSKILGRIHMHTLKVGEAHLPCTFTVLENDDVDFLFGLDMLKRHQCCIDLRRNFLVLGSAGKEVPFLAEKDLPVRARGHHIGMEEEEEKRASAETAVTGAEGVKEMLANECGGEGGATGEEQLMQLGFSQEQARSGLLRTNNNVEEAATLLFAEFGGAGGPRVG